MCVVKNEGLVDRFIRIILGIVVVFSAYFLLHGLIQIVSYIIGTVALVTGLTGFCALYKIFGISTLKR